MGSPTLLTECNVVSAVTDEPEFPNWFRTWCNTCQRYVEQPHNCTTPGEQKVEESRTRLEQWLSEPYTFEN